MFHFTIRDVLWLMLAVGMGCALWLEHQRGVRWHSRGEAAFRALDDADLQPTWHEDRVLVHPFDAESGERFHKLYYGLMRPD